MPKMTHQTSSLAIANRHWRDVEAESLAWFNLGTELKKVLPPSPSIFEAMSGCGFCSSITHFLWPSASVLMNDISPECRKILLQKFPRAQVLAEDVNQWVPTGRFDLCFIDYNNFTLKRIEDWKRSLVRLSRASDHMIITDSACYGFAMGNLRSYSAKTPWDYYNLLSKTLQHRIGKGVASVVQFGHAALVWLKDGDHKFEVKSVMDRLQIEVHGISLQKPFGSPRPTLW